MIAKFRTHGNRSRYHYMTIHFFVKNVVTFVWRLLKFWRSCLLQLLLLTKFRVIKLMREPYDLIHHLEGVRSGLDSSRIFSLFIYVFIAWYIHNLVSWFLCFSMFSFRIPWRQEMLPAFTAGIEEARSLSNPPNHLGQLTIKFLHQISGFFTFILV